jgi:hypothetical protein
MGGVDDQHPVTPSVSILSLTLLRLKGCKEWRGIDKQKGLEWNMGEGRKGYSVTIIYIKIVERLVELSTGILIVNSYFPISKDYHITF